jgi:phosphoribosyl-AMP cyclohydrolase
LRLRVGLLFSNCSLARQVSIAAGWPSHTLKVRTRRIRLIPDFAKNGGLVPAIAQDADSGAVLMLAWMNREAYEETARTLRACYFSRSRNKLWRKGEESGNIQEVAAIFVDCDADTVLLKVRQIGGAACHEGYASCFFRQIDGDAVRVIGERVFDPATVYGKN